MPNRERPPNRVIPQAILRPEVEDELTSSDRMNTRILETKITPSKYIASIGLNWLLKGFVAGLLLPFMPTAFPQSESVQKKEPPQKKEDCSPSPPPAVTATPMAQPIILPRPSPTPSPVHTAAQTLLHECRAKLKVCRHKSRKSSNARPR